MAINLVAAGGVRAEEGGDVGQLTTDALTAMNAEKWDEAFALLQRVTDGHDAGALQAYGPQFGVLWYRRGICEMKLRKWPEAMRSFEKCYRDYPNPGRKAAVDGNLYQKKALLKWGEAAVGAEKWETAVQMFRKFLDERDRTTDIFPQGAFHVNLAVAYFKLGKIAEGNDHLEIAISNRENFPTADTAIVSGFQALVTAAIQAKNEQILMDFILKNRALICFEPCEQQRYSAVYLSLAATAETADMHRAALALYQLVPDTDVAVDALKGRIAALGARPAVVEGSRLIDRAALQEDLARLENERRGGHSADAIKLAGVAVVHEKLGNLGGACAAYEQLERYHDRAETREDNLFNLVRTAALIGDSRRTDLYGGKFLEAFPKSAQLPAVRRLVLTSLFFGRQYARSIEAASAILGKLEPASKERDLCLHVLGGSLYYTGEAVKAQPLLDEHLAKYPASTYLRAALFFQASNSARLQDWPKAAERLDAFLAKETGPDAAPFIPYALYDRAACHHATHGDPAALALIARLEKQFPEADVMDLALNLKGRILQDANDLDGAKNAYAKALDVAERRDHRGVAGAVIANLVALLGSGPEKVPARYKEAVAYADRFWKTYAKDSADRARVAICQTRSLDSVGRGEEALTRLQEVFAGLSGDSLDEASHAYAELYRAKHDLSQLQDHFSKIPGIPDTDRLIRPRLRLAVIDAYEEAIAKTADEAARRKLEVTLEGLYQELKTKFPAKDLESPVLLRVGNFLREKTSSPRESLPYYEEVLSRADPVWRCSALYGRGDVLARSATTEIDKGIADFEQVYADTKDAAEREIALFRIIGCYLVKEDKPKVLEKAKLYLSSGFTRFSNEVAGLVANDGARPAPAAPAASPAR